MPDMNVPVQRIRAVTRDEMLEPDAMRGTEQFLRGIKDGDGNDITPVDEEEARRQFHADAIQSRAPIRVTSSMSQTPASQTTLQPVPVSESAPVSPNVQRAPLVVGDRTPPVVSDPGVDWQAKARAEGWAPRGEGSDAPPTLTPVPNAEPANPAPETAPEPEPASSEGRAETF